MQDIISKLDLAEFCFKVAIDKLPVIDNFGK